MLNLTQNPLQRPSATVYLPTLLTHSFIWALRQNNGHAQDAQEERWLLGQDHELSLHA